MTRTSSRFGYVAIGTGIVLYVALMFTACDDQPIQFHRGRHLQSSKAAAQAADALLDDARMEDSSAREDRALADTLRADTLPCGAFLSDSAPRAVKESWWERKRRTGCLLPNAKL